jgi:peptidoglycan/LPS O-acetylase OafA/YrhL
VHEDGGGAVEGPARSGGPRGFGHVTGLDGLRGLAVVGVLLYHAGHLTGGYLGVDLFFVLSGYLITSLLLVEHHGDGRIDLRAFWTRRMRRLLPALLGLLVGVAAYARWVARPIDLAGIRGDAIATLFYVANWHTILGGSSYWDISKEPSPLQHTWSLAIEEQFYLVWPLVVFAIAVYLTGRASRVAGPERRARLVAERPEDLRRMVGSIAVSGAVLSFAAVVAFHALGMSDTRIYEGTDTRVGAILGGAALAAWAAGRRDRPAEVARTRWWIEGGALAAAVVLGYLWFTLNGDSLALYRGMLPLASVLAVVVVAAVADPASPVLGRVLSFEPLRALGLISYGLYLWHWPVFLVLDERNGRLPGMDGRVLPEGQLLLAKLVVSLLVAILSYLLIEQPIRRGSLPRPARLPLAIGSAVAVLALVLVATQTDVKGPDTSEVATRGRTVAGAPKVLIVGDSVAQSIARPLVGDSARFDVNVVNKTHLGCSEVAAGVNGVNSGGRLTTSAFPCHEMIDGQIPAIDPDVVFVDIGARPNDKVIVDGTPVGACEPAYQARYEQTLGALIDEAGSGGARVGVATVVHSGERTRRYEGSEERIDCANQAIAAAVEARPNAFVVDLDRFVCPDGAGSCREEIDGGPVRSDGLHFDNGPAGIAVAGWVVDQLKANGLAHG